VARFQITEQIHKRVRNNLRIRIGQTATEMSISHEKTRRKLLKTQTKTCFNNEIRKVVDHWDKFIENRETNMSDYYVIIFQSL